jgi:hypothetical protein
LVVVFLVLCQSVPQQSNPFASNPSIKKRLTKPQAQQDVSKSLPSRAALQM